VADKLACRLLLWLVVLGKVLRYCAAFSAGTRGSALSMLVARCTRGSNCRLAWSTACCWCGGRDRRRQLDSGRCQRILRHPARDNQSLALCVVGSPGRPRRDGSWPCESLGLAQKTHWGSFRMRCPSTQKPGCQKGELYEVSSYPKTVVRPMPSDGTRAVCSLAAGRCKSHPGPLWSQRKRVPPTRSAGAVRYLTCMDTTPSGSAWSLLWPKTFQFWRTLGTRGSGGI
jgi:hypothetical protein